MVQPWPLCLAWPRPSIVATLFESLAEKAIFAWLEVHDDALMPGKCAIPGFARLAVDLSTQSIACSFFRAPLFS